MGKRGRSEVLSLSLFLSLPLEQSRYVLVDQFLVVGPQLLDVGYVVALGVQIVFAAKHGS